MDDDDEQEDANAIKGDVKVYLKTLSVEVLEQLFVQSASCIAILRLVHPLAKLIIFRLLYVENVSKDSISAWVAPEFIS